MFLHNKINNIKIVIIKYELDYLLKSSLIYDIILTTIKIVYLFHFLKKR